jgi:Xaa-Pro aminopeptidase
MTGPEGYLCDISRTFLCGDKADAEQREAYRVAYDFIHGVIEQCRPGVTYAELCRGGPKIPEEYAPQAYSCMMHGSGFDDEPPYLPFVHQADAGALVPRGALQENMVLSVEFYAGKVGGRSGVKLEEQILITARGAELLSRYPFEERLLR